MTVEYKKVQINTSQPEPNPIDPLINVIQNGMTIIGLPHPDLSNTQIGASIGNTVNAGVQSAVPSIPGLSDTLTGINKFIANTEKPDFAKNLLGLSVGIILSLIAIGALLYEQNPVNKVVSNASNRKR